MPGINRPELPLPCSREQPLQSELTPKTTNCTKLQGVGSAPGASQPRGFCWSLQQSLHTPFLVLPGPVCRHKHTHVSGSSRWSHRSPLRRNSASPLLHPPRPRCQQDPRSLSPVASSPSCPQQSTAVSELLAVRRGTAPCPASGQMNEGGTEASSAPAPLPALRLRVPQRLGQPRPYSHAICSLPQPKQAARERRGKPAAPGAWPGMAATF